MNLKNLMVDTKSAWVSYPGFEGFEVEVVHLSREKLMQVRKSCVVTKIDRKTRAGYEDLDEAKFVDRFTRESIKNWKGLKLDYLDQLMPLDITSEDPQQEVPFDPEVAVLLVRNSADFDTWLNEVVFDLDNFRRGRDGTTVGTPGEVAA